MPLRLRDNLHWCERAGRAVFLDLEADRYFCLPRDANDAFLRLAAHDFLPGDAEKLHLLLSRGLLIEDRGDVSIKSPPAIQTPMSDYLAEPFPRVRPIHIARALAWEARLGWLLGRRPLLEVLEVARHRSSKARPTSDELDRSLQIIVAASSAIACVTRKHNRCLVRALAVHAACKKSGIQTKLVLGVVDHPFAAHCWIQRGSSVVVGEFEQARLFNPIFVLE